MTFKELALPDEPQTLALLNEDQAFRLKSMICDASPVMKIWFGLMAVNFVVLLLMI